MDEHLKFSLCVSTASEDIVNVFDRMYAVNWGSSPKWREVGGEPRGIEQPPDGVFLEKRNSDEESKCRSACMHASESSAGPHFH